MAGPPEHVKAFIIGSPPVDFARPLDVTQIHGKTAIVTGGSSGIGLGIAEALALNGANVAIFDLNEHGQQIASDLVAKGLKALFVKTDTASWDSQLAAFKATLEWSGSIDIVVPAAGIQSTHLAKFITPQDADDEPQRPTAKVLEVNLIGVYWTVELALFYFNKLHRDSEESSFRPQLLLISSLAGFTPSPFSTDYGAAKYGVRGLWLSIRTPAPDMARWQANLLAPAWVRTSMTEKYIDKLVERGLRVASVEEVVKVAMRLITDQQVYSRAVCIVGKGTEAVEDGGKGSGIFDINDDVGDRENPMMTKWEEGVFDKYI